MESHRSASQDALGSPAGAENVAKIVWLEPRGSAGLRQTPRRRISCGSLVRVAATLAAGVLFAALSGGRAVAPAAAHIAAEATVSGGPDPGADEQSFRSALFGPAAASAAFERPRAMRVQQGPERLGPARTAQGAHDLIDFEGMRIPRGLVETILRAAEVTGVDPAYMMALADKESSFVAESKASTSSAEGLFQFIEKTWFEMVRDFGPKHGLEASAAFVETVNGKPTITSEPIREWVLGLRRNPYLSALMAAEMLKRDRGKIERRIGRDLNRPELYLMHFLGAENAGKLLELVSGKPKQSAPRVFPDAAKANKALFFAPGKRKTRHLTVAEVYDKIDRMIDRRLDRYEGVAAFAPVQDATFSSRL